MADSIGRLRKALKDHSLLFAFITALIPLVILLIQQFLWLTELDRTSALAHRASLRSFLSAVDGRVEHTSRASAERLLNVPADHLLPIDRQKIADYWRNKPRDGVRRLFVVDFTISPTGNYYAYRPETNKLISSSASSESLAIVLATLPWQMKARDQTLEKAPMLEVNEFDLEHRIVLKPVVDDASFIVGVVGFVIDESYIRNELLTCAIEQKLASFFPPEMRRLLTVSVTDGRGDAIVGPRPVATALSAPMSFVFKDWRINIADNRAEPSVWAAGTLRYNMTIGLVLAAVLLFGIGLAFSSARHAMHLSQMKSDFVSNVSHELRTPVCSIRLFAEFLRLGRAKTPEKVKEYAEYIESEGHRLSRLIENILDFSRIESKRKAYRREPTDLRALVQSVVNAADRPLDQAGCHVQVELPEASGPVVDIDPDAIAQALHNLLDNAAKYSEDDGAIIVRLQSQRDHVVISVQDHGIGIAKDDQNKVFERFHRVSTGLVHDVKGCGLGLSLVEHTLRAHGGRVELNSELGVGSTFSLWLPTEVGSNHAQPSGR